MASSAGRGVTKTNLGGKRPEEKGTGLGSMPLTLFLLVAAVAVYLRVSQARQTSPAGLTGGSTGTPTVNIPLTGAGGMLQTLLDFAARWGLTVTSSLRPGDTHSLHSKGRAIDVAVPPPGSRQQIIAEAEAMGIHVLPEEYGPGGGPYRSTGPHWHLSFPEGGRF